MADEAAAFALTCDLLEERTGLNVAVIRGTVRLALQEAGLFDSRVSHAEMAVVAKKLLPRELGLGGMHDADEVCAEVAARLETVPDEDTEDTPDAVFARLGLAS